ncbi:MAG: hypothetical protein BAA01_01235 [Bacillus thermozeamaize]|uniref:Uncharacterized protein n=1 Tax=Bacillus thermozeamaize TaxID=230954 RepID=A0A1Y3PFT8_9BACI|nr:MAG: hypothetical protein BAA01_01235 [Bacillus thermozeamaize]
MSKRAAGVAFCGISAFLFVSHYITAALYRLSGRGGGWSHDDFVLYLNYVGNTPRILSIIALAIGIFYLYQAEKEDKKK